MTGRRIYGAFIIALWRNAVHGQKQWNQLIARPGTPGGLAAVSETV
jgi:hypothetical protein